MHIARTTAGAHDRRRGSTFIENAVAFPLFIFALFIVMDIAYVSYTKLVLEHAVTEAGRLASTGQVVSPDPDHPPLSRLDSILWSIRRHSGVSVADAAIEVLSVTADGRTTTGPGGPGDVVTIHVRYQLPVLTPVLGRVVPDWRYTVEARTSFRNEEF